VSEIKRAEKRTREGRPFENVGGLYQWWGVTTCMWRAQSLLTKLTTKKLEWGNKDHIAKHRGVEW